MPDSTTVTCGQCQHFTLKSHYDDFGENGSCAVWLAKVAEKESILINSQFFVNELGGCPIHDDEPRQCNKFSDKVAGGGL